MRDLCMGGRFIWNTARSRRTLTTQGLLIEGIHNSVGVCAGFILGRHFCLRWRSFPNAELIVQEMRLTTKEKSTPPLSRSYRYNLFTT